MLTAAKPEFLKAYWDNSFDLKNHIQEFLQIDRHTLETRIQESNQAMTKLGQNFDWEMAIEFYRDQVGATYILELAAWHLKSCDYIGNMLHLIADFAKGRVLDFGGGIGTHSFAAALCPNVTEVQYLDVNPINCNFVLERSEKLGLSDKIQVTSKLEIDNSFDTIMCFDVMEHLPDPISQLIEFHKLLSSDGKLLINWYFSKGFGNEYPFHLDDTAIVKYFFQTLQSHFLEVFHPHLITTRCYQKL
ncbi:MAG: class I SAM-dependent methyltransferase [Okeania sp. SIO2C9]|uniref:class I SAM-dependent methyltransferase n=1 Tax=Okeania sp. SIO2C9 TaxID=2607791 RepID=UPI0013C17BC4|nr:methyltransferase domain-containing protein [Okeania sp. SIO2C9]NEQ76505.1 class I SAM-dependent methyltransferase [Okeania sp. SIO2C9]